MRVPIVGKTAGFARRRRFFLDRQQAAIDEISQDARSERTFVLLFDLSACELENFAVFDAGRAHAFAVAAIQTAIDVGDEGITDLQPALIDQGHLAYASAWRIRFAAPQAISGAIVGTKAAMNAARVVFVFRFIGGRKAAERESEFALGVFVRLWRSRGHDLNSSHETAGAENGVGIEGFF
jgi:hypothetical protein